MRKSFCSDYLCAISKEPDAVAFISGSPKYHRIKGRVMFYSMYDGVIVCSEIKGLPTLLNGCKNSVFAFHIHSGNSCSGNETDPFADVNGHYNPQDTPHPCHAGDMPPLFGADGKAFSAFFTKRFYISEIIGKTVIIHAMPDDFTTQPSGNAGEKMACGEIIAVKNR